MRQPISLTADDHSAAEPNPTETINRRRFLQLLGASLALAGLAGCTPRRAQQIQPYVHSPEQRVQGKPLFFATAMTLGGYAIGLLAESHEGRPTKLEGNLDHPASLGGTGVFAQAAILSLYDPDRSQFVTHGGGISTWDEFVAALATPLAAQTNSGGAGLRVLTETVTSPTLEAQLKALLAAFPQAHVHRYEPVNQDNARAGAQTAFGEIVDTVYQLENAAVVVDLDADFMTRLPGNVAYANAFMDRRRVSAGQTEMNRLYVVESSPSATGSVADHRLPLPAGRIAAFVQALAAKLGLPVAPPADSPDDAWVAAVAKDLQDHRGAGVLIVGPGQPPAVHALAHAINENLGNVGKTVIYVEPVDAAPIDQTSSLADLTQAMAAGSVEMLVILGANPVYAAPADLDFAGALEKVPFSVHLGLYDDETAAACTWHIAGTHFLEMWSDARAFDGTTSIIQPLIEPLYDGKSEHEVIAALLGKGDAAGYDLVRATWQDRFGTDAFEEAWRRALYAGVIPNTQASVRNVSVDTSALQPAVDASAPTDTKGLEIVFAPDSRVWDGRFANNAWLQEMPKNISKLTWDNAALMDPATAAGLGVENEDVLLIEHDGAQLRAPVWIMPGHAEGSITLTLGYGRERAGQIGNGLGVNAYRLRTSTTPWIMTGATAAKTGERYTLATTQDHQTMEGRDLVRTATLAAYQEDPQVIRTEADDRPPISLYPEKQPSSLPVTESEGYQWGMAIDLTACIGCHACTIACQAENNIPITGKEGVLREREMHWIRVDRYYGGDPQHPTIQHQPVPCMQCENAPCEVVCPVGATLHDSEGINDMVYNRCVGTRYCSNNCPYKVRRFNFFDYSSFDDKPVLELLQNPDVTVRGRGVMEKCTYCVQRISAARIDAKKQGRSIQDGEVITACQQACPTRAIVFGDISDPNSQVSKLKAQSLNYALLAELNTRPRTTYLAALRNPNPALEQTSE